MKRIKCKFQRSTGDGNGGSIIVDSEGWELSPLLAAWKLPRPCRSYRYDVIHRPSGLRVKDGLPSLADCQALADRIGDVAGFEKPEPEYQVLREVRERMNAR